MSAGSRSAARTPSLHVMARAQALAGRAGGHQQRSRVRTNPPYRLGVLMDTRTIAIAALVLVVVIVVIVFVI